MVAITISYRRADSDAITGRIFDRLVAHFGNASIFRDIDNIPLGVDFRDHLNRVLSESSIVLVVVGPKWLGSTGGRNRISDEADPVRVEVEIALRRGLPLIPVLVGRANMPKVAQLPDSLKDFAYRNGLRVDAGQDFDNHVARLVRAMDQILESASNAPPPVSTTQVRNGSRRLEAAEGVLKTSEPPVGVISSLAPLNTAQAEIKDVTESDAIEQESANVQSQSLDPEVMSFDDPVVQPAASSRRSQLLSKSDELANQIGSSPENEATGDVNAYDDPSIVSQTDTLSDTVELASVAPVRGFWPHKKIGRAASLVALVMLFVGFIILASYQLTVNRGAAVPASRADRQEETLAAEKDISRKALARVDELNAQIATLREQLSRVTAALDASDAKVKEQQGQIIELGKRLNLALVDQVAELARYRSLIALGLEIKKIIPKRTAVGLVVEGDITTSLNTERPLPRLRVALNDGQGSEVQFKIIDAPKSQLPPGEVAHFETTFEHPNSAATGVKVTFTF